MLEQFPTEVGCIDNVIRKLHRFGIVHRGQVEVRYMIVLIISAIRDTLGITFVHELMDEKADDRVKAHVATDKAWLTMLLTEVGNDEIRIRQFSSTLDYVLTVV